MQDVWQLTICVILGYMAAGLVFTILLYPAYLLDPEHSFAGDSPEELGAFTAVFCMSLSALSQTAVDLSDLAPTSGYTICVVVIAHFVGKKWSVIRFFHLFCESGQCHSLSMLCYFAFWTRER